MNTLLEALFETWHAGGFVMPYLVASAVALWYAIGERSWTLKRGAKGALEKVLEAPHPTTGVLGVTLQQLSSIPDEARTPGRVKEVIDPMKEQLGRHQMLIITIATLAPLMGLLGTVTGMIETFDSLTNMAMHSSSGGIAGGISEALVSTQMGLAVAVPALLVGRLLDTRQSQLEDELDRIQELAARTLIPKGV